MAVPFAQYPGGMMVHVLWFPIRIQGGVGVRIISSTVASNTSGYLHMAVHDVPGMFPSNVFGPHAGGVFVGTLGEVYPPPRQVGPLPAEAAQYVMAVNPGISIYRAYDGTRCSIPTSRISIMRWIFIGRTLVCWAPEYITTTFSKMWSIPWCGMRPGVSGC